MSEDTRNPSDEEVRQFLVKIEETFNLTDKGRRAIGKPAMPKFFLGEVVQIRKTGEVGAVQRVEMNASRTDYWYYVRGERYAAPQLLRFYGQGGGGEALVDWSICFSCHEAFNGDGHLCPDCRTTSIIINSEARPKTQAPLLCLPAPVLQLPARAESLRRFRDVNHLEDSYHTIFVDTLKRATPANWVAQAQATLNTGHPAIGTAQYEIWKAYRHCERHHARDAAVAREAAQRIYERRLAQLAYDYTPPILEPASVWRWNGAA